MATILSGAPPTAIERLRSSMRQTGDINQQQRQMYESRRVQFRESVRGFLQERNLERAPISRRDLQELTDVQFYASHSFLNFASFASVVVVTFCLGLMGWGRDIKGDYKMIHDGNQTVVTPVFWANSMWLFIFLLEGIFVIYQLFHAYQHLKIVEESISYWFFAVNCFQLGWIISYSFDIIWLSTLFLFVGFGLLCVVNYNLYYQDYIFSPRRPIDSQDAPPVRQEWYDLNICTEFVIFRAPFQVHCAWAFFTVLVQFNEMYVESNWPSDAIVGLASLILLWVLGICILFIPRYPLFIMPIVISWGAMGIWVELSHPRSVILQNYEHKDLARMKGAAIATCIEHLLLPIIRFAFHFATTYNIAEKVENTIPSRV
mmetsp:Transcript_26180/g.38725  ORF Transcript_26180/g.38725 Transcript_26180/m.38725 type:complete len:374 (-) Transcript_26180:177-1298(-)